MNNLTVVNKELTEIKRTKQTEIEDLLRQIQDLDNELEEFSDNRAFTSSRTLMSEVTSSSYKRTSDEN